MINVLTNKLSKTLCLSLMLAVAWLSPAAQAYSVDRAAVGGFYAVESMSPNETTQSNGMSLSQAVDSVRRQGNVDRVISANTRVSGGREVHYIKVLTKDGKVRTHKVNGRKR